jgi:hypothetical protein
MTHRKAIVSFESCDYDRPTSCARPSSRGVDADGYRQKFRPPHPVQCEAPKDEKPKGGKNDRPATPGDTERERSAPATLLSDEHGTVPLGI